jgi:hypothetical protein
MSRPSGQDIVDLARTAIGGKYVLWAIQPKDSPVWIAGDCAEFASWLVYRTSRVMYGVRSVNDDPETADAYTGYWARDCRTRGTACRVEEAEKIVGAFILRSPGEKRGHIVVSDGMGGTIEAHSTARGVIASTTAGRVWTVGVLPPGIDYKPVKGMGY